MELYTDSSKIDANEVKKILYKTKVNAKFSHYTSGNLYYTVELGTEVYQFPISTVNVYTPQRYASCTDPNDPGAYIFRVCNDDKFILSPDLGTTSFYNEIKASELNRWIAKAIEKETFIKIN